MQPASCLFWGIFISIRGKPGRTAARFSVPAGGLLVIASPGAPADQACGRGEINLYGYFKALVDAKYEGPVCLEVIGPEQTLQ